MIVEEITTFPYIARFRASVEANSPTFSYNEVDNFEINDFYPLALSFEDFSWLGSSQNLIAATTPTNELPTYIFNSMSETDNGSDY